MKINQWFHLFLAACLAAGGLGYLPTPGVVRADEPLPPLEGIEQLALSAPAPAPVAQTPEDIELRAALETLEAARNQGPEAVVALLDTLRGPALDLAMGEILEAQEQLAQLVPPRPASRPVSEAEEQAALQANLARDAANRAQALAHRNDPAEGQAPMPKIQSPTIPNAPAADLTVGSAPCTHATIAAAMTAANPGDRLMIEGGVTFNENIVITKNLTLQGGYSGCGSGSTARTTLDGGGNGTVVVINASLNVTLTNLNLTNGISPESGGGIRFNYEHAGGRLNLNHVDIYGNSAIYGGGIWVGMNGQVEGTDVDIYNNTASGWGGGVRLYGGRATFSNSDIHDNTAPRGAGVYGTALSGFASQLGLPSSADLYDNQALTGSGLGGGLYMAGEGSTLATVNIDDCSDLYSNDAIRGGGAYLISATLTIHGDCSEIQSNTATGDGGGLYAQNSVINMDNYAELISNRAGYGGGAGNGGGAYLDNSNLMSDLAQIRSNTANNYGGGVYAVNDSLLDMDLGAYTCLGPRCSRLAYNTATSGYGGGVYASESEVDLRQTFVENNTSTLGGGIYAWRDPSSSLRAVYAYNCLFARNDGGDADGIRLLANSGQTTRMAGSHNTLAYNPSTGDGVAIGMAGIGTLDLSLSNSIVWGHTTSINDAAQTVTCSDIQGGYAGAGNINADPLFVSAADANFHIQTNSPAVDQCATGQNVDFDNAPRPVDLPPSGPNDYDMGADEAAARVGINGAACAYFSIQDAVDAASPGDTVQAAGDTFYEVVNIAKSITIAGGYDFATCGVSGANDTTIDGSAGSGSTIDVTAGPVTLRDLQITRGGDAGTVGGGLDVYNAGTAVTLDNSDVTGNTGSYGGGIYVGPSAAVTLTNYSNVSYNTATQYGGGARVWGTLVGCPYCHINGNSAPNGGGLSVPSGGALYLDGTIVHQNQASGASPDGRGGGILLEESTATLDNNTRVSGNSAVFGAGMYIFSGALNLAGNIYDNAASNSGGGIYADTSVITLTNSNVGGVGAAQANRVTAGVFGAGLYLTNTHALLDSTIVASNTFTSGAGWGAGIVAWNGSVVTLTNDSRVENHHAPNAGWFGGTGAGLLVYSSTVTLDNSQVLSNTADIGGGGIYMVLTSTLNVLNNSYISYNHAATGNGGGIAATGTPDINISKAVLQLNTAGADGGAIYLDAGALDFTGWWAVTDNTASRNGGAVAVAGTGDASFYADEGVSAVVRNQAGGNGGALYTSNNRALEIYSPNGYLLSLSGNQANGHGGAAYADGGALLDVFGVVLMTANLAPAGNGGVFYLAGGSRLWLADDGVGEFPRLEENRARNGGAVYAQDSPRVECDGAEFGHDPDGNHATAGEGGAIYLSGSALDADNCVFYNNDATDHGGAIAAHTSTLDIYARYPTLLLSPERPAGQESLGRQAMLAEQCDPLLDQCSSLYGNTADSDGNNAGDGGAIYTNDSTLRINHTYLHRNSAYRGGAIYQTGANANAQVANSLIYSNTVGYALGAGIRRANGVFTVTHTTLANNVGGSGFSGQASAATNTIAWGNDGYPGFAAAPVITSCNIDDGGYAGPVINPQFVSPGAGEDYHLQGGSPAIDACATGLSPDLDNVARPVSAGYDMGAYEFAQGVSFTPDNTGTAESPGLAIYMHTLTNTGGVADTYTLTAQSGQGWAVAVIPSPMVTLNGGESAPVTVTITIPAGVPSGTVDTTIITAASHAAPSLGARVVDTTTITCEPVAGADFIFAPAAPQTGETVMFTGSVTGGVPPLVYTWSFGDGTGQYADNPIAHTFLSSNTFTVWLTVTNGCPSQAVISHTVVVTGATIVPGYGVEFSPNYAQTLNAGEAITYVHRLTNTGNVADTFDLTLSSSRGWAALLDPGPFNLAAGGSAQVRVRLDAPAGSSGLVDTTVITATSQTSPTVWARVADTTTVSGVVCEPVTGVDYAFAPASPQTGETVAFTGAVTSGSAPLVYTWNFGDGTGMQTSNPIMHTFLSSSTFTVWLTVTNGCPSQAVISHTVVVTGATIVPGYGVEFSPDYSQTISAGEAITYVHHLTNTANVADVFSLALSSSQGWATLLDGGPISLAPGGSAQVRVRLDAPAGSSGLVDTTVITATSQTSPTVWARVADTTTVSVVVCAPVAGVDYAFTPASPQTDQAVTFTGSVTAGDPPLTYTWNFDDGTGVFTGNPIAHTFTAGGAYTVWLTVTNGCPSLGAISHTVTVSAGTPGFSIFLPLVLKNR